MRSATSALVTTTAAAPSEICEALPAVTVPSGVNAGRSFASSSTVGVAADPLVSLEDHGIALALRNLDRHDLAGQAPRIPGVARALRANAPPMRPGPRA